MLDIKNYLDKKAKGLVTIAKVGDSYAVAFKKFSSEDGNPLPDDVQALNLDDLIQSINDLQKQIVDLNSVISDCQMSK
jgi:hypothetical protein